MTNAGIRVVELTGGGDPALLERVYAEVLAPSFGAAELESTAELLPRLGGSDAAAGAGGGSFVAVALAGDGSPVGTVIADPTPETGVLLLSYLAVRADARRGGVGAALLGLLPGWRTRAGADHVLAEVEDPRFHPAGRHGDPAARLAFYQRHGYALLPVPFVQPRVRPGVDRVDGMLLLVLGERAVPRATLRRFLAGYLRAAEDLSVCDDPTYAALLARLDRTEPLDPVPPDRYSEVAPLDVAGELLRRDYPATATAAELLGGADAVPVLDRLWASVLARIRAGEQLPRPGRPVLAGLVDELEAAEAWSAPAEPAGETMLAEWFSPPADRWAGWWRDEHAPPAWRSGPPLREPAAEAVRRLAPMPRLTLVLADVAGLSLADAASITGFPVADHRAILAAARNVVVALLDQRFARPGPAGQPSDRPAGQPSDQSVDRSVGHPAPEVAR